MVKAASFGRTIVVSMLGLGALVGIGSTAALTSSLDAPPAELVLPTFGGGGESASSGTYGVQSLLGQPEAVASEGGGFTLVPGPVVATLTATTACPGANSPGPYDGCRAGARITTTLHTTDQRPTPRACGSGRTCTAGQASARVLVFDRTKLDGLAITTRDGASVTLLRNPDGSLYDDIFESERAQSAAGAAAFGCAADATGTCTAGVGAIGDLLVLVRFADGATTVYAGQPLDASSFVDTNGDTIADLATKNVQIQKRIDKDGVIKFTGGHVVVV